MGFIIVLGLSAVYLAIGLTLFVFQRPLLYLAFSEEVDPATIGLTEASVSRLETEDGKSIVSWFVRRPGPFLAIYFHGNGMPLSARVPQIHRLTNLGFSVLAIDYRGFGGSTGSPTEDGLHTDADRAYDEALRLGFSPEHIVLLGESLGSGVALALAAHRPVAGVILDAPYSSVADVAAGKFWFLPVRIMLWDQFRSDIWIKNVTVPILILHGANDGIIPVKFGRRLARAGGAMVSFVTLRGAGHVVFCDPRADEQIERWLRKIDFTTLSHDVPHSISKAG